VRTKIGQWPGVQLIVHSNPAIKKKGEGRFGGNANERHKTDHEETKDDSMTGFRRFIVLYTRVWAWG
jgi:hypothetical protein